jgi:hypothetical protein
MDSQTLQARFASQEQAESAVRKLSSLRGDRFRLERATGYSENSTPDAAADPSPEAFTASEPAGSPVENYSAVAASEFASDLGGAPAVAFTLSADVPMTMAEQARRVILDAGGQMM